MPLHPRRRRPPHLQQLRVPRRSRRHRSHVRLVRMRHHIPSLHILLSLLLPDARLRLRHLPRRRLVPPLLLQRRPIRPLHRRVVLLRTPPRRPLHLRIPHQLRERPPIHRVRHTPPTQPKFRHHCTCSGPAVTSTPFTAAFNSSITRCVHHTRSSITGINSNASSKCFVAHTTSVCRCSRSTPHTAARYSSISSLVSDSMRRSFMCDTPPNSRHLLRSAPLMSLPHHLLSGSPLGEQPPPRTTRTASQTPLHPMHRTLMPAPPTHGLDRLRLRERRQRWPHLHPHRLHHLDDLRPLRRRRPQQPPPLQLPPHHPIH